MPKKKRPLAEPPALFALEPEFPQQGTPAPSSHSDGDQFVDQFMYALMAPYMYFPPWDTIWEANDNRTKALVHRLGALKEIFEQQQATEFEAMLYISTATLVHPPSHDWFNIYMWLFNRWNPELAKENDLKPDRPELNVNQREDLARLRRWIFNQQMQHLKAKRKAAEKDSKQASRYGGPHLAPALEVVEQPKMF